MKNGKVDICTDPYEKNLPLIIPLEIQNLEWESSFIKNDSIIPTTTAVFDMKRGL